MAYQLACEPSDHITAFASMYGAMAERVFENCKPSRLISILAIHGTKDTYKPYTGKPGMKSIEDGINLRVSTNACESTETQKMLDIDPEDESTIEKTNHTDCAEGSCVY